MASDTYTKYFPDPLQNHGYTIIREIARGLYGVIYEIQDASGNRFCMKYIELKEALQELDVMSRFRHPHIINAHEVYKDGEYVQIVMPLADGSAADLLHKDTANVKLDTKIRLIYEIVSALAFLQINNVLHCDIKVENILLRNSSDNYIDSYAVVADLGMVKYYDYDITTCQTHKSPEELTQRGTQVYRSLSAARDSDVTQILEHMPYDQIKVSMYALGIMLTEILSGMYLSDTEIHGVPVYVYNIMEHSSDFFRRAGIPKEWIPLLVRLTDTNPDIRPSSFKELLRYPSFENRSFNLIVTGHVLVDNRRFCNDYTNMAIKFTLEDVSNLKLDISGFALLIELLYRVLSSVQPINADTISLIVSSLIYLSVHILDQALDITISEENYILIIDMIYVMYTQLNGIIYTDTIYTKSRSAKMLKELLEVALVECKLYITKTVSEHVHALEQMESVRDRDNRINKTDRELSYYIDNIVY